MRAARRGSSIARQVTQSSFRPPPGQWFCSRRCYAKVAGDPGDAAISGKNIDADGLCVASQARFNEIGVQQISGHVHPQVFRGAAAVKATQDLVDLSRKHLSRHDLLGKNQDTAAPVGFDLPQLQGNSLDEHFYKLGMDAAEPYLSYAKKYARANCPPKPRRWAKRSGWTKYHSDGSAEAVDAPNESMLTFDTEVMWKETQYACMACAVSDTSWYSWISPHLLGESETDQHLIPLGDPEQPRIVVGHNIGYDRARVAEEYDVKQSKNSFLDTMSLHVAVNGMCSRQRPKWMKHRKDRELRDKIARSDDSADLALLLESGSLTDEEEDLWIGRSSVNSLRDVAQFHCGVTIDKARRDDFGALDKAGVVEKLDELLDYCAADVDITHKVYKKVFPLFLETCPHPVSFAALRFLSQEILPVDRTWDAYLANAEATYHKLSDAVEERLIKLAENLLLIKNEPTKYEKDPWLSQLDWSGQEIRMVKGKRKADPPRPAARQKMPGMPKWYKDLFLKKDGPINLTVRTRVAPILLRLSWDGFPLCWSDKHGWTFRVPIDKAQQFQANSTECDMAEEGNPTLQFDTEHRYFKVPHKDGPSARCASPLAKSYLQYFEKGTLSSEYFYAKEALEMNASCSYWISARDRIKSQMVVYQDKETTSAAADSSKQLGLILPQIIPMGTITRRAVENTWLTASNAKINRVGSELKSMVRAPPGYCFVGADVDSQELWIASLIGDAQFKVHGGCAIGFMTLEGTKAAGTDLHSRTAEILGISRNDAKVFNYGRIYGAGLKFAATLLRQFNPSTSDVEATSTASRLYRETKGQKTSRRVLHERSFWRGGTESLVFNALEDFAEQERPRTPVLGAGITEALMRRFISKGGFMTSRINWAIQSSGVDYLHLLIISMDHLARRFNISARLALTVHDEIRYLVRKEDAYRAALALQVANVWTRAMFSQQMGIDDLPQACACFSAVDIDHVLRKEVDMDCVTPSHPNAIPPGESLDIQQLLAKGDAAKLDPATVPTESDCPHPERFEYQPRTPVVQALRDKRDARAQMAYLQAQIADEKELRDLVKEARNPNSQSATTLTAALSSLSPSSTSDPPKRSRSSTTNPSSMSTSSLTKKPPASDKVAKALCAADRKLMNYQSHVGQLLEVEEPASWSARAAYGGKAGSGTGSSSWQQQQKYFTDWEKLRRASPLSGAGRGRSWGGY